MERRLPWCCYSGDRLEEQAEAVSWSRWEEWLVPRLCSGKAHLDFGMLGPWHSSDWSHRVPYQKPTLLPRTLKDWIWGPHRCNSPLPLLDLGGPPPQGIQVRALLPAPGWAPRVEASALWLWTERKPRGKAATRIGVCLIDGVSRTSHGGVWEGTSSTSVSHPRTPGSARYNWRDSGRGHCRGGGSKEPSLPSMFPQEDPPTRILKELLPEENL